MLISFCMPVYNKDIYLRDSIESIVGQTYNNIEIILVDDNSTDGSAEICKYYSEKFLNIHYHRNKANLGVAVSRNIARMHAHGEVICVHDPDDLSMKYRAEMTYDYFKKHKEVDIIYGGCKYINELGSVILEKSASGFSVHRLKQDNFIPHPTVAYRSKIPVMYRRGIRFIDDWYFYLDCYAKGLRFGWINETLSLYRVVNDGLTFNGGFNNKSKEKAKDKLRKEFKHLEDDVSDSIMNSKLQMERLSKIAKKIKSGSTVLELGCNGGAVMGYLRKKRKCRVEGVEISSFLTELCKKRGLSVKEGDILTYSDKKKRDYVVLGDVIEHYRPEQASRILDNAFSMLKPGGSVIITVPYEHGMYSKRYIPEHVLDYTEDELRMLLRGKKITIEPIVVDGDLMPSWLLVTARR